MFIKLVFEESTEPNGPTKYVQSIYECDKYSVCDYTMTIESGSTTREIGVENVKVYIMNKDGKTIDTFHFGRPAPKFRGTNIIDQYFAPEDREWVVKRIRNHGIDENSAEDVRKFLEMERKEALQTGNCWIDKDGYLRERLGG